jgi:undecaprenyl-diphosphatase
MTLNSQTFQLAQQIQNPTLTSFSKFIAIAAEPLVLLFLTLAISIFLYLNKQKSQAILLASTSIITALAIKLLKNIFQFERPISTLIQETGYSLPSGHTTFAVVFFGLMTYIFVKPKYKIPATIISIILVSIIAFTRIYLQVHWITDIIAGLILGGTILTISILIYKKNKDSKK